MLAALTFLAGIAAVGTTPPAPVTPAPAPAGAAHSWYVGDLDPGRLQALGAADADRARAERLARSVTVLDLGDPDVAPGSSQLPDHRGTASPGQTREAVVAFARGWVATPGAPPLLLVLGTSNYGAYVDGAHGAAWGRLTEEVATAVPAGVEVRGGLDAETTYAGPRVTRAFARGYLGATRRPLVDFGDCGCTPGQALAGGWTRADRAAVAAAGAVLPQQYRTNGVDAARWGSLERDVRRLYGHPLDVLGVLTEVRACAGPPARDCAGIDLGPDEAVARLSRALGRPVPAASDIGYLAPPPPPAAATGAAGGPGRRTTVVTVVALVATAAAAVGLRARRGPRRRGGPRRTRRLVGPCQDAARQSEDR